jgi:hypothetical protein
LILIVLKLSRYICRISDCFLLKCIMSLPLKDNRKKERKHIMLKNCRRPAFYVPWQKRGTLKTGHLTTLWCVWWNHS